MKYIYLIILLILISSCLTKKEKSHNSFIKEIGNQNHELLLKNISRMESNLKNTYKKDSSKENVKSFLKNLITNEGKSSLEINKSDCFLVREFEKTELEDQFEFLKYDTIYLNEFGQIETIDQEGIEEIDITPPEIDDSINKETELQELRKNGYSKFIKKGILSEALLNNNQTFIKSFYSNNYGENIPSIKDYAQTILNLNPDYEDLLLKVLIYYEIYLLELRNRKCGFFR